MTQLQATVRTFGQVGDNPIGLVQEVYALSIMLQYEENPSPDSRTPAKSAANIG